MAYERIYARVYKFINIEIRFKTLETIECKIKSDDVAFARDRARCVIIITVISSFFFFFLTICTLRTPCNAVRDLISIIARAGNSYQSSCGEHYIVELTWLPRTMRCLLHLKVNNCSVFRSAIIFPLRQLVQFIKSTAIATRDITFCCNFLR